MDSKEMITVPRVWLEGLQEYADKVLNDKGEIRQECLSALLGYIDSVNFILKNK